MEPRAHHHESRDPGSNIEGPHILSMGVLNVIRDALSVGWIAGLHLYFGGGRSGDSVAFSNYDALLSHVTESRPGDLFYFWSIAQLRNKGLLLVDRQFHGSMKDEHSLLSQDDLERVRGFLAQGEFKEILSVSSSSDGHPLAILTDLEGSGWNQFLESGESANVTGGAIYVMPFTQVDSPDFYLARAKRPNALGEVPKGGAY